MIVEVDLAGMALQVRVEEAEAALVGTGRADEAVPHEMRRGDAGDRGPAGMEALGPRALLEEQLHARRGARRDALRRDDLVRVEAKELAAATAELKWATRPVAWKPTWWKPPLTAAPRRIAVSVPAGRR